MAQLSEPLPLPEALIPLLAAEPAAPPACAPPKRSGLVASTGPAWGDGKRAFDRVREALEARGHQLKKTGKGYITTCPAHDDHDPSLSIGDKPGRVVLNCFGGCSTESIVAALGLHMGDLFDVAPEANSAPAGNTPVDSVPRMILAPITAAQLQGEVFKPLLWRIPKYFPVGLGLFSSPPKHGKTSILVDEGTGLSTGGEVLGQKVEECGVLLLLLEDPPRRIQDRIRRLLGGKPWPKNLYIVSMFDQVPLLHGGLEEWLSGFFKTHPEVGFLGIDILNKIMPARQRGANVYDADVKALRVLHEVTHQHQIATQILHHDAKKTADPDFVQNSSGSAGLSGTCDTIWNLQRGRMEGHALLQVVSREGDEHRLIVQRDPETYHWTVAAGRPEDLDASTARREVLDVFMGEHLYPKEILSRLAGDDRQKRQNAERAFYRAARDGALLKDAFGRYYVGGGKP